MLKVRKIQDEQRDWAVYNFGANPDVRDPMIGAFEEFGELCDALYAEYEPYSTHEDRKRMKEEVEDAIADVFIYLLDYCNRAGWSMEVIMVASGSFTLGQWEGDPIVERATRPRPIRRSDAPFLLGGALGRIGHSTLKGVQGIRGPSEKHSALAQKAMGEAVITLHDIAAFRGVDFAEIVLRVWAQVRARDWRKKEGEPC